MTPPFRISVVQLTMEPVERMLALARASEGAGFDVFWLGEAYPWWRKHSMEARSSTSMSALIARETERIGVGWGIISPYTRHPVQIAMEARLMQEVAGEGRFFLGLGPSKIFMRHAGAADGKQARPLTAIREAVEIIRRTLGGESFEFEGKEFAARVPSLTPETDAPRTGVPIYLAGTAPRIQKASGEISDGLLTASITTPAFVEYARANMEEGARAAGRDLDEIDLGSVIVASVARDRERGREGAREIAAMYLANKVQNIASAADVLLEKAGLTFDEIRPVAEAMERGGRKAAAEAVSDELLDKCKPIAGTPEDCVAAIEEFRAAGCRHILLELWGDDRLEQVELLGREVLPRVRG